MRVGSPGARLRIDFAARTVHVNDSEVMLTPTEYEIVACLALHVGRVVTIQELIESVWGEWFGPVDHVFVHMHHIRRKLGVCARYIVTKRTVGYLLRDDSAGSAPADRQRPTVEYLDLLQQDADGRGVIWLVVDQERRISWISDSVAQLLGMHPREMVGKHPWEFVHEDDARDFKARFPVSGGEALLRFEARIVQRDGTVSTIRVVAQVLHGVDGRRLGGIGEWRVVQADDVRPGVGGPGLPAMPFRLHYDGAHRLIRVEPLQAFLGWDPHALIGNYFSLAGIDRDTTDRIVSGLLEAGAVHRLGPTLARKADGEPVTVDITLYLEGEGGSLAGYVGEVRVLE